MNTVTCKDVRNGQPVEPTDKFQTTTPIIHFSHTTDGPAKVGDVFVMQWIAEDVGAAAPKNTVIATVREEVTNVPAGTRSFTINSRLTKPNNNWPVGKYRVEIKLADKLLSTARFTVAA